ncbi:MAG: peptidase M20, partial [Chloroflexi bacterium]|nr:peptidase M20 [Chloroflexota bacterium]
HTQCRQQEEAEKLGATLDLQIKQEYQAFHLDPHAPAVLLAASTFRRLNLPVELTATGGGSDANELNQKGLETVVLGTGMVAPHTVEERISVAADSMRAQLVVELITAT